MDRNDPRKAARTDSDTEGAAFPELFVFDAWRRFSRHLSGFLRGQTPALSPRILYRLAALLKGFLFRLFLRDRCCQRGEFPRPPLFIEEIYFLQAIHRADFLKQ